MTDYERIKREFDLSALERLVQQVKNLPTLEEIWPVGSIYMSLDATDPAVRFGGRWERIENAFLLAAGDAHPAGETGGEERHTLTDAETPARSFRVPHVAGYNDGYAVTGYGEKTVAHNYEGACNAILNTGWHILSSGGGGPHNNMPPYVSVYVWQRVQ